MPEPLDEARIEKVREMIEDGCSKREISRTVPIHYGTLEKYFPEYRGWTPAESAAYVQLRRQENELNGRLY